MIRSFLFVCLGNICRSPAGEGILLNLAKNRGCLEQLHVESCGTGDWHLGRLPDARMSRAAKKRGLSLTSRAQQFKQSFFDRFDYILAADQSVLEDLKLLSRAQEDRDKIFLMSRFSQKYRDQDIPDPYYGGESGFEHVLDMLEDSCEGILDHVFENMPKQLED